MRTSVYREAWALTRGRSPAGLFVRRLLPAVVGLPFIVAVGRLAAHRTGVLSTAEWILIGAAATALGATILLLSTAVWLERLDRRRRLAEAALRRSREQHRALAGNLPDGAIVLFDSDLRHLIADGAGLAGVGLSREMMEGKTIWEVFPAEVCQAIEPAYRAALEGHESTFEYAFRGSTYLVRVVPVRDDITGEVWSGATLVLDISDRKRDEAELVRTSRLFARTFENAPIGAAIVGIDGRLLDVNRSLCDLLGYTEEGLERMTFAEIAHLDDPNAVPEFIPKLLADETRTYQSEERYRHQDGSIVWAQLTVSLVRDARGDPLYLVCQFVDTTQRKLAELSLAESRAQLAEAQTLARLGSWSWDVAADTVQWSDELHRIFGLEPGSRELTYTSFLEFVHPADRPLVETAVDRAYRTGEPFAFEHRIVRTDGEIRWLHGRGEVLTGEAGPLLLRGTSQDITDRMQVERRYRTLVEQLPLVMYVRPLDLAEPSLYISPQIEELLGYPAEEWQSDGGLLARIVHPEDRELVLTAAADVRHTGTPFRGEYRYVARDGRVVWVQDETYLVHDDAGRPVAVQGYLLDITRRKEAEEERDRLQAGLHQAQKIEAIGRLAGGVAHEFNNMLMAISGHSELVLARLDVADPTRRNVELIVSAAERAAAMTRELLAVGRKQVLQPTAVDLNGVAEEALSLIRPLVGPGIEIATALDPRPPATFADRAQLGQVVVNLLLNARDAISGRGAITVGTKLVTVDEAAAARESVEPGRFVALTVTDTGCGMDADTQARIFEPFFTTKPAGEGTGLGLSTAYGIVRQCGGFLTVDSEPERGTTMAVHLPCDPQAAPPAAPSDAASDAGARSALVVDDEESVRAVCAELLGRLGYRVLQAGCGEEALALLSEQQDGIALLLTDVVMPGMSGPELARRVATLHPAATTVYMSGYSAALADGEIGPREPVLQKPFSAAALEETVGAAVSTEADEDAGRARTCLVADDHPSVLDAVCRALADAGIDVVARCGSAEEAVEQVVALQPDVAVVDVALPELGGVEVARRTGAAGASTRILLYTGHPDAAFAAEARAAGARGVVLKSAPLGELVRAVRAIAEHGTYVDGSAGAGPENGDDRTSALTAREREVLRLVAEGQTNDQVGRRLSISPETVQTHVRNAAKKLGAQTRTQAVAIALRRSLISV